MFYLELGGEREQYEGKPQQEDSDWTDQHPSKNDVESARGSSLYSE